MDKKSFEAKLNIVIQFNKDLIFKKNEKLPDYNGIYEKYKYPILTNNHTQTTKPIHCCFNA
jgi:4-O-beta-D-mannosyl-D-glucose phosphorylase